MSGGSYNYSYSTVEDEYINRMHDVELNDLISDLVPILKAVEWWQSGDHSEEYYREIVSEFKKKWFKQTRAKRLEKLIAEECDKLKDELIKTL